MTSSKVVLQSWDLRSPKNHFYHYSRGMAQRGEQGQTTAALFLLLGLKDGVSSGRAAQERVRLTPGASFDPCERGRATHGAEAAPAPTAPPTASLPRLKSPFSIALKLSLPHLHVGSFPLALFTPQSPGSPAGSTTCSLRAWHCTELSGSPGGQGQLQAWGGTNNRDAGNIGGKSEGYRTLGDGLVTPPPPR